MHRDVALGTRSISFSHPQAAGRRVCTTPMDNQRRHSTSIRHSQMAKDNSLRFGPAMNPHLDGMEQLDTVITFRNASGGLAHKLQHAAARTRGPVDICCAQSRTSYRPCATSRAGMISYSPEDNQQHCKTTVQVIG